MDVAAADVVSTSGVSVLPSDLLSFDETPER
jgi:hypothetical protein